VRGKMIPFSPEFRGSFLGFMGFDVYRCPYCGTKFTIIQPAF